MAGPAPTWRERVFTARPARRPRTRAIPARVVLKRKVTRNPVPDRLTRGELKRVRTRAETARENVAVTVSARFSVTAQVVFVPVHAPPHPLNLAPAAGVAVSTMLEFAATFALHVVPPLPHLIPPPVTAPLPVTETESENVDVPLEKVALRFFALVIERLQVVAVPLQAPPQPVKVAPEAGVAVRLMLALSGSSALHVVAPLPQLMPPPVIVPVPLTETVSGTVPLKNVALTLFEVLINTVQVVAVPPHAPLQPMKVAPVAGDAVSVTVELRSKLAEQAFPLLPQLIAPLPSLTLPLPVTATVSWGAAAKVAVTVLSLSIVTAQAGTLPEQASLQPVKA